MRTGEETMVGSEDRDENLSSCNSAIFSFVRFINKTHRRVDVIWINYEGVQVKFKTLNPGEYFDVNTFVTHPWIFMDSETHDALVVKKKKIYVPEPWYQTCLQERPLRRDQHPVPKRINVEITIPVYSLRDRSMQVIRKLLSKRDEVSKLDLPKALQKEVAAGMCA